MQKMPIDPPLKLCTKKTPPFHHGKKPLQSTPRPLCPNLLYPTIIVKSFPVYGFANVDTNQEQYADAISPASWIPLPV